MAARPPDVDPEVSGIDEARARRATPGSRASDRPSTTGSGERGQAHSLEAVVASMIVLAGVAFSLQMTAVTPLSASTSNQHLENQLQATGDGVLASAAASGDIERALLYWNGTASEFHNADNEDHYTTNLTETNFTEALDRTYGPRNIAYNVYLVYHTSNGETERQRLVFQGEPSDHAVSASRTVTLLDSDELRFANGTTTGTAIGNTSDFYAPDAGTGSGHRELYNHVRVEVVAWRI